MAYVTDELRLTFGGNTELSEWPMGQHMFGTRFRAAIEGWRFGTTSTEGFRSNFAAVGGWVLNDTPGGRAELRELTDPSIHDMIELAEPSDPAALWFEGMGMGVLDTVGVPIFGFRIREASGRLAGTGVITKPAVGMAVVGALTAMADPGHARRMLQVAKAGRRPAGILFADLESSSPLARRLSTASYFTLGRRLVRAADRCVIDSGGLPGRHAGDGVVAFFPAETAGTESAAARACVEAARADVAGRSDLEAGDVRMRFGLHWGSTLYIGSVTTGGRSEVTALGDEVNEAARIEACATGSRMLASKSLMERLDPDDAATLGLDPDHVTYTPLAELAGATDKARRDAPAIAVCEL
jgi:class 3 adenylate cyclase